VALTMDQVAAKVKWLKQKSAKRDQRMGDIQAVRRGDAASVFPDLFPATWPKPVVANFVDVAARDLAEVIAPLPSFNCMTGNMVTETAKKRAAKRTKVAHYYVQHSRLAQQMPTGCDQYLTYGFLPMVVEPDFEANCPRVRLEDPMGSYPEFDRWGQVVSYAKVWHKTAGELAAEWPEHYQRILGDDYTQGLDTVLEVIRFSDGDRTVLYIPARENLVLAEAKHGLGRCPVVVVRRPGLDDEMRGQFDDVMWVQMARARMALLQLEATEKSVSAPLAIPDDVQDIAFGSDALLRTRSPEKVRRVGMELPQGAFAEQAVLDAELHTGARYPEGRQGDVSASVITGRGIQSLLGGFDTQVKTAQLMLEQAFEQVINLCFHADQVWFGNVKKTVRGTANSTPFEETYTPNKDIAGDHTIDVSYGFAAGMDPNRALVFMLQLRGDNLIDRATVQRQLPFDVDVVQLQQGIDIEDTRDALKQAVFGLGQAIPALAAEMGDPQQVMDVIAKLAGVIKEREKGVTIEDAVTKLFAPPPPPEPVAADPMAAAMGGAEGGGGGAADPLAGIAPGQAGMGPGGRPDLQTMLAGLSSGGTPNLAMNVSRKLPVM
jgi:hypothetical protein